MSYEPHDAILDDLVEGKEYVQEIRWSLFKDLGSGDAPVGEMQVLITIGDKWSVIRGPDFKDIVARLVEQL